MADIASSSNDTSFVITIDDTSPTIVYSPFKDTFGTPNLTVGWNPTYSNTSEDNGTSLHVTSANGASLSVSWNGTAVSLYGFFPLSSPGFPSSISYSVSLDGTSTTNYASNLSSDSDPATSVLASFTNLTNGEHIIQLTMHNPDDLDENTPLLQFDRAVITSSPPDQSLKQSPNFTLSTETLADKQTSFRGQWSFSSGLLPGQDVSFHTSTNIGDWASVQFNGTSVTLAGLTTPHSGSYNISLDNEQQETLSARSSFNLTSPTILFYKTGLDPDVVHQLNVVNAGPSSGGQGSLLILGSVNVTTMNLSNGSQPAGNTSSSSLHKGTIAALVVGIVLATVALVALSVCYIRRRRRDKQRKQNFIVNPRVSSRRLSFMRLGRRSQQVDPEKAHRKDDPSHGSADADIVDITGRKEDEDDEDEDGHETSMLQIPGRGSAGGSRHGSQNSDGSYSISLPELPGRGHVRLRSDGDSPTPTQRYTAESTSAQYAPPRSPLATQLASPRSPKPRGPREMRASTLGIQREGPQGILLKEMYTPAADLPVNVLEEGRLTATGGHLSASQPATPLRVNFDEADVRPQRRSRSRSAVSGISLPASLRQAFSWAQGRSADAPPSPTQEAEPRATPRYSFLDMESSTSHSQSSGSSSTRHSHSTRSSSKSHPEASESSGQAGSDIPPVPHDHRTSLGLSMIMAGGPTSSQPSLSPDISLQAVPLPPLSVPEPRIGADDVPQSVHPTDLAELLPSPTDSVPLTVSDIHFRHSTQSSISPSESHGNNNTSHRTAHPPLPTSPTTSTLHPTPRPDATPRPDSTPYVIQKLVGDPNAGPGPSTPYGSPRISAPSGPRLSPKHRSQTVGPSFSSVMASRPSMSRLMSGKEPGKESQ